MTQAATIPTDRLFVTARQLSKIIGCDQATVLKMLHRHEIPGAFRTGTTWRIPVAWIRQHAGLDES
jgi:excisionase family DNA binding protein